MSEKFYNAESVSSQAMRKAAAPTQARVAERAAPMVQQLASAPMAQAASSSFGGGGGYGQIHQQQQQQFGGDGGGYGQMPQQQQMPLAARSSPLAPSLVQSSKTFPQMPACLQPVVRHDAAMLADYKNDPNPKLDLGRDGAFSDFSVCFFAAYDSNTYGEHTLKPALEKKGFRVTWFRQDQHAAFVQEIESSNEKESGRYDVIGFTSTNVSLGDDDAFAEAVKKAHKLGTGLFIFADNQANLVLPAIAGCIVTGDDMGNQELVYGADPKEAGRFSRDSIVFAGVNSLYEGVTICYPCPVQLPGKVEPEQNRLQTLATSTFDRPVISCLDATDDHGRVIVDTGFTKLSKGQWNGQERYVVNAAVWLTNVEKRYGGKEPTLEK